MSGTGAPGVPSPWPGAGRSGLVADLGPGDLLYPFNQAGVLSPADVHTARALSRLGASGDPLVVLATALAVRAPRVGHVLVDLASVAATVVAEGAAAGVGAEGDVLAGLPWPELGTWRTALEASPLVNRGEGPGPVRPLRLVGEHLYLERYWRDEGLVAGDFLARAAAPPTGPDRAWLAQVLELLFPGEADGPQAAAATACLGRRLTVVAGGPGTGKTTVVARALALAHLDARREGRRWPLVGLAAPTGKAAARMAEAVHEEARRLDVPAAVREQLLATGASTVHRLLGRSASGLNRFRHDRRNQLPHDMVVVDETSMMSLPLMARLVEAVRGDARLVLVGDPEQLASVEAGAVLADVTGPSPTEGAPPAMAGCTQVLRVNHRFHGPLAELADAVRRGSTASVLELLGGSGTGELGWLDIDVSEAGPQAPGLGPMWAMAMEAALALADRARRGDAQGALAELGRARLLCAHREGPAGASTWNALVEARLAGNGPAGPSAQGYQGWYPGRPVVVTENDYGLGLFNGDTGVAVSRPDGGLSVVFPRGGMVQAVSPAQLGPAASAFAMTAHRAQGSELDQVAVLLPGPASRVLTRELLYTALTRARRRALVVGSRAALEAALSRPVARASGLGRRLRAGPAPLS